MRMDNKKYPQKISGRPKTYRFLAVSSTDLVDIRD
jgi:hypothetical protein